SLRSRMPNTKKKNPSSTALLKWETAGKKLATALSAYLQSCIFLDTFCDIPSQDTKKMASRVDTSLDTLHPKLFDELAQSRVVLARMRNKISARSYLLPKEILAEIFKEVVYVPGPDENPFPSMPDHLKRIFGRLHCLLAICSTWRNTTIELSELWSIIPAAQSKASRPTPEAALLALQRSRALTSDRRHLHFAAVLSNSYFSQENIPPFLKDEIPPFTSINIEARCQLAVSSISHLLTKVLTPQSPPVLSELSMHHYTDPCEDPPPRVPKDHQYIGFRMRTQQLDLISKSIGSLSAFRLRNINIRWGNITFSHRLVEMHLQSVVLGDNSKLVEFLRVIESASELRDLRLVSVVAFVEDLEDTESDTGASPTTILLPKLQSLLLDDLSLNVLTTVLTAIAPGSHKLKVHPSFKSHSDQSLEDEGSDSDWSYNDRPLMNLLNRSNIDTLFLSPCCHWTFEGNPRCVDREELCEKLQLLPNLKTLIMYDWKWDSNDILALDRNLHKGLPKLTGLYILNGRVCDAGYLPQIASSHSLQTLVLDSYQPYSILSGCDPDWLMQSLKAIVPDFRLAYGLGGMDEFDYYSWRLW
ncbi:unnamed protein product, partial [Rhizoctonia solani]